MASTMLASPVLLSNVASRASSRNAHGAFCTAVPSHLNRQPYVCTLSKRETKMVMPQLSHSFVGLARSAKVAQVAGGVAVDPTIAFRAMVRRQVRTSASAVDAQMPRREITKAEEVYFDGGAHYGDIVMNLIFGLSVLWLPITLAAVARGILLRYRITDARVTVVSGWTGEDRSDIPYGDIKEVLSVPRFVGAWGDIILRLKDGTNIEIKSVPRFMELKEYILAKVKGLKAGGGAGGNTGTGFA